MCYLIFFFVPEVAVSVKIIIFKALCSIMGIEKSVSCIEVDKANV